MSGAEVRGEETPPGMKAVSVVLDFYITEEVDAEWFGEQILCRIEVMPDVSTMSDGMLVTTWA